MRFSIIFLLSLSSLPFLSSFYYSYHLENYFNSFLVLSTPFYVKSNGSFHLQLLNYKTDEQKKRRINLREGLLLRYSPSFSAVNNDLKVLKKNEECLWDLETKGRNHSTFLSFSSSTSFNLQDQDVIFDFSSFVEPKNFSISVDTLAEGSYSLYFIRCLSKHRLYTQEERIEKRNLRHFSDSLNSNSLSSSNFSLISYPRNLQHIHHEGNLNQRKERRIINEVPFSLAISFSILSTNLDNLSYDWLLLPSILPSFVFVYILFLWFLLFCFLKNKLFSIIPKEEDTEISDESYQRRQEIKILLKNNENYKQNLLFSSTFSIFSSFFSSNSTSTGSYSLVSTINREEEEEDIEEEEHNDEKVELFMDKEYNHDTFFDQEDLIELIEINKRNEFNKKNKEDSESTNNTYNYNSSPPASSSNSSLFSLILSNYNIKLLLSNAFLSYHNFYLLIFLFFLLLFFKYFLLTFLIIFNNSHSEMSSVVFFHIFYYFFYIISSFLFFIILIMFASGYSTIYSRETLFDFLSFEVFKMYESELIDQEREREEDQIITSDEISLNSSISSFPSPLPSLLSSSLTILYFPLIPFNFIQEKHFLILSNLKINFHHFLTIITSTSSFYLILSFFFIFFLLCFSINFCSSILLFFLQDNKNIVVFSPSFYLAYNKIFLNSSEIFLKDLISLFSPSSLLLLIFFFFFLILFIFLNKKINQFNLIQNYYEKVIFPTISSYSIINYHYFHSILSHFSQNFSFFRQNKEEFKLFLYLFIKIDKLYKESATKSNEYEDLFIDRNEIENNIQEILLDFKDLSEFIKHSSTSYSSSSYFSSHKVLFDQVIQNNKSIIDELHENENAIEILIQNETKYNTYLKNFIIYYKILKKNETYLNKKQLYYSNIKYNLRKFDLILRQYKKIIVVLFLFLLLSLNLVPFFLSFFTTNIFFKENYVSIYCFLDEFISLLLYIYILLFNNEIF